MRVYTVCHWELDRIGLNVEAENTGVWVDLTIEQAVQLHEDLRRSVQDYLDLDTAAGKEGEHGTAEVS